MDYDDQMVLNEEEKLRLTKDIDVDFIYIARKRQQLKEMEEALREKKNVYRALKVDIKKADIQIDELN